MKKQRKWVEREEEEEEKGEEREGPTLSADKRQKWMNPIGRRASCSLLSPRLRELRTHFIEICEIRKAGYRVIYHRVTPAHTSSQLHNKSHNWHFFSVWCLNNYVLQQLQRALGSLFVVWRSNKLELNSRVPDGFKNTTEVAHKSPGCLYLRVLRKVWPWSFPMHQRKKRDNRTAWEQEQGHLLKLIPGYDAEAAPQRPINTHTSNMNLHGYIRTGVMGESNRRCGRLRKTKRKMGVSR